MVRNSVLITGASAGIGQELARCFAAAGDDLVLVARRAEALEQLATDLRSRHNIRVRVEPCDLAQHAAPAELFARLSQAGVTVDVLVNNAGFGALGEVADLALDRQLEMIELNVTALTALTRLFLPAMLQRKNGGVLNVASTAGFQPGPRMAVYYATKAYVLSFTEALAEETAGTGLRVSCLCPGPTKTEFGSVSGMDQSKLFRLGTMTARDVAELGYRGWCSGKVVIIAGLTNRLAVFGVRLMPRWVIRKIVKSVNGRGS
jgi:short-subunit dehydrogenase